MFKHALKGACESFLGTFPAPSPGSTSCGCLGPASAVGRGQSSSSSQPCPTRRGTKCRLISSRASGLCFTSIPKASARVGRSKRTISSPTSDEYTQKNAVVVGSGDDVDSHKSFCTKEGLNFKLLADSNHAIVQKYGSIMEYNSMTLAACNTLFDRSHGRDQKGAPPSQSTGS
jgi:AhpC/TSA family